LLGVMTNVFILPKPVLGPALQAGGFNSADLSTPLGQLVTSGA
jgi:hypothetical protein